MCYTWPLCLTSVRVLDKTCWVCAQRWRITDYTWSIASAWPALAAGSRNSCMSFFLLSGSSRKRFCAFCRALPSISPCLHSTVNSSVDRCQTQAVFETHLRLLCNIVNPLEQRCTVGIPTNLALPAQYCKSCVDICQTQAVFTEHIHKPFPAILPCVHGSATAVLTRVKHRLYSVGIWLHCVTMKHLNDLEEQSVPSNRPSLHRTVTAVLTYATCRLCLTAHAAAMCHNQPKFSLCNGPW